MAWASRPWIQDYEKSGQIMPPLLLRHDTGKKRKISIALQRRGKCPFFTFVHQNSTDTARRIELDLDIVLIGGRKRRTSGVRGRSRVRPEYGGSEPPDSQKSKS